MPEQLDPRWTLKERIQGCPGLSRAVDGVRREVARALAKTGPLPRLPKLRWALLKNRNNWTTGERQRMGEPARSDPASIRAFPLVAAVEHLWGYLSPTWAGRFLGGGCRRACSSRLEPLGTAAASLIEHGEAPLNYFRAKKAICRGPIEGLNSKVNARFKKSYGFHTDEAREIALFHVLGKLPEPQITLGFF